MIQLKYFQKKRMLMSNIDIVWINESDEETLPIDCPVCETIIATQQDVSTLKNHGCCEECHLVYYYPNKEKWNKGWRPKIIKDCNN